MSRYKWFKHFTNSSATDPLIGRAESQMGALGFSMVIKLRETIVGQTIYGEVPMCEIARKNLCKLFGCREAKLNEFITLLKDSGQFEITEKNDVLKIKSLNMLELLSNQAVSSKVRYESGEPDRDTDLTEKNVSKEMNKKLKKNDLGVALSSNHFLKTVEIILAKSGKEALSQLPNEYEKFIKAEKSVDSKLFDEIKNAIHKKFDTSEKARSLGNDITIAIQAVFDKEFVKISQTQAKENKAKHEAEMRFKRTNSPRYKDNECRLTIREIEQDRGQMFSRQDYDSNLQKYINYWKTEKLAREQEGIFFQAYDKFYPTARDENAVEPAPSSLNEADEFEDWDYD